MRGRGQPGRGGRGDRIEERRRDLGRKGPGGAGGVPNDLGDDVFIDWSDDRKHPGAVVSVEVGAGVSLGRRRLGPNQGELAAAQEEQQEHRDDDQPGEPSSPAVASCAFPAEIKFRSHVPRPSPLLPEPPQPRRRPLLSGRRLARSSPCSLKDSRAASAAFILPRRPQGRHPLFRLGPRLALDRACPASAGGRAGSSRW